MAVTNKRSIDKPQAEPGTLIYNQLILRAASMAIQYKHSSYEELVKDIADGWLANHNMNPDDVAKTLNQPIVKLFKEVESEQI